MSYTYLPQKLTPVSKSTDGPIDNPIIHPTPDDNQVLCKNPTLDEAAKNLTEKIDSAEKNSDLVVLQNNQFLLGQLYYEHQKWDLAKEVFEKLSKYESKTIFCAQAVYQLAIMAFDIPSNAKDIKDAFLKLEGLLEDIEAHEKDFTRGHFHILGAGETNNNVNLEDFIDQEKRLKLFRICINYNLGLATFNGYNPNIKSGEIIPRAADYWLAAAGGSIEELLSTSHVKASDIFKGSALVDVDASDEDQNNEDTKTGENFRTKSVEKEVDDLMFYKALAQSKLGMIYCLESDLKNMQKSFFWHTEAAGNGSIESQGALGVFYLNSNNGDNKNLKKSEKNGLICLKNAASNNNLYALGRLVEFYYQKKLYGHCLAYSKSHAIKFFKQSKEIIIDEVVQEANKNFISSKFNIKGAVLCAFYFARLVERGIYQKVAADSGENMDDMLLFQDSESSCRLLFSKCASVDPILMVELQGKRLYGEI